MKTLILCLICTIICTIGLQFPLLNEISSFFLLIIGFYLLISFFYNILIFTIQLDNIEYVEYIKETGEDMNELPRLTDSIKKYNYSKDIWFKPKMSKELMDFIN